MSNPSKAIRPVRGPSAPAPSLPVYEMVPLETEPPGDLDNVGKSLWGLVASGNYVTAPPEDLDYAALHAMCVMYEGFREAMDHYRKDPNPVNSRGESIRSQPLAQAMSMWRECQKLMDSFGLTPKARYKLYRSASAAPEAPTHEEVGEFD